jgi:hypothetical protein
MLFVSAPSPHTDPGRGSTHRRALFGAVVVQVRPTAGAVGPGVNYRRN